MKPVGTLTIFDLFESGTDMPVEDVVRQLRQTDSDGFNAIEVSRSGEVWPMVSILINREWTVISRTDRKDGPLQTLEACSPHDTPDEVAFKYHDGTTTFTRGYLNSLRTAEEVIRALAHHEPWPAEPAWVEI